MEFPEPTNLRDDRREVLLEYLDFYRWTVREKVTGLDDAVLRTSRLASGWTPIELVKRSSGDCAITCVLWVLIRSLPRWHPPLGMLGT